ncbi:MAG: hypothetical protein AAGM33_11375 [Pseudomonadota bacterium]
MNKEATATRPQHDHDYQSQIAALRRDFEQLQDDVAKLGNEMVEDAGERMKYYSDFAGEKLKEKGEDLREAGDRGKRIIAVEVKRHPIASVLGAASAGLALGALALWSQSGTRP